MKNLARFALAVLILSVIATAQSVPPIDVFGGYSYMTFRQPATGESSRQDLNMRGWNASAAFGAFHHFSVEADFSHHSVRNCGGVLGITCSNFSYLFGPRYTFGDRSKRLTFFVHALGGRDRADLVLLSDSTVRDTSVAFAAGAGADYWLFRHVGLQLGPADFIYTDHLSNEGASSQGSFRASAGIAFRIGGNFPPREPKPAKPAKPEKAPKAKSEGGHRSWKRPWHKNKPAPTPEEGQPEGQPSETKPAPAPSPAPTPSPAPASKPAPTPAPPSPSAQPTAAPPSNGMPIHPLGIVVAPQEFEGAKIVQIEPGSVAELASLHVGDLITGVDGKKVRTPMELAAKLADRSGKVRIRVQRGAKRIDTEIVLGNR